MDDEPIRSRAARAAAELALVRVVHHYGDRPEFVVLGGLVPQLLCSGAGVAHGRRKPKDWYDIAFVLLHNDAGGPQAAARLVLDRFGPDLDGLTTAMRDLAANFSDPRAQGPTAYAEQFVIDHPAEDTSTLAADALVAVETFCQALLRN
jgi:hypothetical protein